MSRESVAADRQSKMFVFLLSVILIVSLVGFGLRHLLPSADDAAMASMETLKTAFAERAQLVHVYWINNGKRSVQYLDVQDWGDEDSIRIAYQVNAAGWVVDASFVGKRKNLGVNPCERLWESVLQKNSFEVMGNVHAKTADRHDGCIYNVADNGYMKYSFSDGSVRVHEAGSEK